MTFPIGALVTVTSPQGVTSGRILHAELIPSYYPGRPALAYYEVEGDEGVLTHESYLALLA